MALAERGKHAQVAVLVEVRGRPAALDLKVGTQPVQVVPHGPLEVCASIRRRCLPSWHAEFLEQGPA